MGRAPRLFNACEKVVGQSGGTFKLVPPHGDVTLARMQFVQECSSANEFLEVEIDSATDPEVYYLVTIPPWDRKESEVVCECPSYIHRGRCRHQREALAQVCDWSELDGPEQTTEQRSRHVCPQCGRPTQTIVIGD